MKERPIPFNDEMVRAILEGRKTQTRRVMKKQPSNEVKDWEFGYTAFTPESHISGRGVFPGQGYGEKFFKCPYGKKGDRLWVREAFKWQPHFLDKEESKSPESCLYRSDDPCPKEISWTPSIHMWRWASRITLEITNVRVERLRSISESDAEAEGAHTVNVAMTCNPEADTVDSHVAGFYEIWKSIYGLDSWDQNPWVWAIEFKAVKK